MTAISFCCKGICQGHKVKTNTVKRENLAQTYFSAQRAEDLLAQTYFSALPIFKYKI